MTQTASRWNDAVEKWKEKNPIQPNESIEDYNDRAMEQGWTGVNIADVNMAGTILFTMEAIKRNKGSRMAKKVFRHAAQSCGFMPPGCYRMFI